MNSPKRCVRVESAAHSRPVVTGARRHSHFVPCVDGSGLARTFFTSQGWSGRPCVRPVCAIHMTAGHNALRGSGPGQNPAFEMHWHEWVVLIAGSTGSALRAVRPPNLHITPGLGAISFTPRVRRVACSVRLWPSTTAAARIEDCGAAMGAGARPAHTSLSPSMMQDQKGNAKNIFCLHMQEL